MNVIVIGCTKYGSLIATELSNLDNDVTIIDRAIENFDLLDTAFNGATLHGVEIDTDILVEAGIKDADIFLAMTANDNINLMACQIAKKLFNVPLILSRVYDPKKEYIYEMLGISSINPTTLCINHIKESYLCEQ